MKGILIRIKDGHIIDGEGEPLGKDSDGDDHTFWRSSGHMEIPVDLAIKLELERPQRYEMDDRKLAKSFFKLKKKKVEKPANKKKGV